MSHRGFKDRLYREFARIGQALASEKRLELIDLLAQGPRNVEGLAAQSEMSVANTSQHLHVLRGARLVETRRAGTSVVYALADPTVLRLWLSLRGVAEDRLAEVEHLTREFAVPGADGAAVAHDELNNLISSEMIYLIDVRPVLEFESGHITGAVSMPVEELADRIAELPRDRPIVAYCRGAYCLFADEAVAHLRRHGYIASRLEGGWPEWQSQHTSVLHTEQGGLVDVSA